MRKISKLLAAATIAANISATGISATFAENAEKNDLIGEKLKKIEANLIKSVSAALLKTGQAFKEAPFSPETRIDYKNEAVKQQVLKLQQKLNRYHIEMGLKFPPVAEDGIMGEETATIALAFVRENGAFNILTSNSLNAVFNENLGSLRYLNSALEHFAPYDYLETMRSALEATRQKNYSLHNNMQTLSEALDREIIRNQRLINRKPEVHRSPYEGKEQSPRGHQNL